MNKYYFCTTLTYIETLFFFYRIQCLDYAHIIVLSALNILMYRRKYHVQNTVCSSKLWGQSLQGNTAVQTHARASSCDKSWLQKKKQGQPDAFWTDCRHGMKGIIWKATLVDISTWYHYRYIWLHIEIECGLRTQVHSICAIFVDLAIIVTSQIKKPINSFQKFSLDSNLTFGLYENFWKWHYDLFIPKFGYLRLQSPASFYLAISS